MIVDLLHKEYKENFTSDKNISICKKILKFFGYILLLSLFVTFEVYLFSELDKKLIKFSPYGSLDFLILFLIILLLFSVITSMIKAKNIFYKKSDSSILLPLPIDRDEVIFAKSILVFFYNVFVNFIVSVPLLISYGANRGIQDGIYPQFYVLSLLYPVFVSIFSTGLVLFLLPFYNKCYNAMKNKIIIQILFASTLVIVLCFAYQYILNLFLNLINNSRFDSMFSKEFLDNLHFIVPYLFPVSGFVRMTYIKDNLLGNISISFGVSLTMLIIGFLITSLSYTRFLKTEFSENKTYKLIKKGNLKKINKSLLFKEFILLFRNSNYIFSYTSLLIMQPFLAFVVITSLNSILYSNMNMLLIYYPELINGMNILLLLLFSSIISTSTLDAFSRENKNIIIIKYLPISPVKQTYIKMIIPFIFSGISLFITDLILVSFDAITVTCFFVSLIIGLLLQVALEYAGIYIDLFKLDGMNKNDISFLSTLISVVLPLVLFALHLLMMYLNFHSLLLYFIEISLMAIVLICLAMPFKKTLNKKFIKMRIN